MSDAVVKALQKKASLSSYEPTFREKASDVLRALLFSDDREGQRKAERLSNVLETVTPYGVATGLDDMREAAGQGDYAAAGVMGAMAMVPGPNPRFRAYHGTEEEALFRFNRAKQGTQQGKPGSGFWFTSTPTNAATYGPNIISADLALTNPLRVTAEEYAAGNGRGPTYWAKIAQERGHDGLIIEDIVDGSEPSTIYSVFEPDTIDAKGMFPAGETDPYLNTPKIKAYHGSPHSFDRFSMDKIGTGEGAQAYGHGLYFAEAEDVARNYRDALTNRMPDHIEAKLVSEGVSKDVANTYARWAAETKGGRGSVEEFVAAMSQPSPSPTITAFRQKVLAETDSLRAATDKINGSMYEVEINASPDDFLDWDKPLSEQPENIRQALQREWLAHPDADASKTGADILRQIQRAEFGPTATPDGASKTLKQAGIPGIKYLDAGSRPPTYGPYVQDLLRQFGSKEKALEVAQQRLASAPDSRSRIMAEEAVSALSIPETRNYVVFDENLINIVRKYGIAGASAMLGYNLMDSIDPAQAKQLEQLEQVRKLDSIMGGAR